MTDNPSSEAIRNLLPAIGSVKEPDLYMDTLTKMKVHLWSFLKGRQYASSTLAFATITDYGFYKIYINKYIPLVYRSYFELHEFGHIIFGHLQYNKFHKKQLLNRISDKWRLIKPHLEIEAEDADLSKQDLIKKYMEPLQQAIQNYAMDMEVNSKLFPDEAYMRDITNRASIEATLNDPSVSKDELIAITACLVSDPIKNYSTPIFPSSYNFPNGKSYIEYVDLIFDNIEEFLDLLKKNNSTNENTSDNKLSKDDLQKIVNSGSILPNSNNIAPSEMTKENQSATDEDYVNKNSNSSYKHGDAAISVNSEKTLEKILQENAFSKKVLKTRIDTMYNYNRKKYCDSVIRPKKVIENRYRIGNIIILADCSGSINDSAIKVVIQALANIAKKCGPKSRLIWWDTRLCGDSLLRKPKERDYGTGLTDIASGIHYVKKYLRNSNDKLVIISDFEDRLDKWRKELKTIKNDYSCIRWQNYKDVSSESKKIDKEFHATAVNFSN